MWVTLPLRQLLLSNCFIIIIILKKYFTYFLDCVKFNYAKVFNKYPSIPVP